MGFGGQAGYLRRAQTLRGQRVIAAGALLAAAVALADVTPPLEAVFAEARRYDQRSFHFAPPGEARLSGMRALVGGVAKEIAAGRSPAAQAEAARALSLELLIARDAGGPVWVLREAGADRRGDGLYVFRAGGAPICLQAPHTFFDAGTGEIALAVFAATRAACLFTNTVHRYSPAADGGAEHSADVAHARRTLFAAATEGLLRARPLPIVQLHGFGDRRPIPEDGMAIIADGTPSPAADGPAGRVRAALAPLVASGRVLLFGADIRQLGATTNVEGTLARGAGAPFVHIEMSQAFRRRLRAAGARPLADAITGAFSVAPAAAKER